MTRDIDRLARGIIAAVDRFYTVAHPDPDWQPTPADLLSIVRDFLKAAHDSTEENTRHV